MASPGARSPSTFHSARRLLEKVLGLAPVAHADQPLVRVSGPTSPFRAYGQATAVDPLARRLRAAENWLREGLAADGVTMSAIGYGVAAGAAGGRERGVRRWLGRVRTYLASVAGGNYGGSQ